MISLTVVLLNVVSRLKAKPLEANRTTPNFPTLSAWLTKPDPPASTLPSGCAATASVASTCPATLSMVNEGGKCALMDPVLGASASVRTMNAPPSIVYSPSGRTVADRNGLQDNR